MAAAVVVHTQQNSTLIFSSFKDRISVLIWTKADSPEVKPARLSPTAPSEGLGSPMVGRPGVEERQLEKCCFFSAHAFSQVSTYIHSFMVGGARRQMMFGSHGFIHEGSTQPAFKET